MPKAGDLVTVDFVGATGTKRRPAVVLSSDIYHAHRPDVVLGVLTTNLSAARASTDHILQDWSAAGLNAASAFRSYFGMARQSAVRPIGRLSARDWQSVQACVRTALT
jgi:mRNA interferase MazF